MTRTRMRTRSENSLSLEAANVSHMLERDSLFVSR